jgi:LysR family hydrogen peroxide-inducible transcriptional activator
VKPPVPTSAAIELLTFRNPPPSRQLALVWRRSSAMGAFLVQLAQQFRSLDPALLQQAPASAAPAAKRARRSAA